MLSFANEKIPTFGSPKTSERMIGTIHFHSIGCILSNVSYGSRCSFLSRSRPNTPKIQVVEFLLNDLYLLFFPSSFFSSRSLWGLRRLWLRFQLFRFFFCNFCLLGFWLGESCLPRWFYVRIVFNLDFLFWHLRYTLIFVSRQCRCFGFRRTLPSVLATTHDGTGWACFKAWDRCFFFPEGLLRAIYARRILISFFCDCSWTSVFFSCSSVICV